VGQKEAWEAIADRWAALVRQPGDAPENADAFLRLLPAPRRRALDLACGEGRLTRELTARGYDVVGVDAAPTLVRLAREAGPDGSYVLGDAAALPFDDGAFDLVVAFMSLQDMDDAVGAIREVGRVLEPGGWLCLAIIHPFWSAGNIDDDAGRFVIRGSYLTTVPHIRPVMQVPSIHRPIEEYFRGLEEGRLLVERLEELPTNRATRLPGNHPVYLHLRAVKKP
jgi:ubiquinone/menaquinone biosynthesis C-methylase UbiE